MENIKKRPRIAIIINKRREVEGFLRGLDESGFLPHIGIKSRNTPPAPCYRMSDLRINASLGQMDLTIRCIEDIMPPADKRVPETSGSHSQQKAMLLPGYLRDSDADLVISVSTAESTPSIQPGDTFSLNGSVVLGGGFFSFDAHNFDAESPSHLAPPSFAANNVDERIYRLLSSQELRTEAVQRFCTPPHSPADPMQILCDPDYISVAAINVVHYQAYEQADPAAYHACVEEHGDKYPATIETTHGIVRMAADGKPTLFVSPITDRYKHFNEDVDPAGKQNTAASYNAGVTVALFLRELDKHAFELIKI